jgi:hypothetical protein
VNCSHLYRIAVRNCVALLTSEVRLEVSRRQDVEEPRNTFAELFKLAQEEASAILGERGSLVIDLKYGFAGGEPQMPRQMCPELGITPERVRQLLRRSLLIMHCLGRRQIASGDIGKANARLLLYLEEILRPGEPGLLDRLHAFTGSELACLPPQTHGLPLLVSLLYGGEKRAFASDECTHLPRPRRMGRDPSLNGLTAR